MEKSVVAVNEDELLLEDVCWGFEKDGRRETVLGVFENKTGEASGAYSLFE